MPVGAQGGNAKLYMKTETTEGTAATGNYEMVPFFEFDLAANADLGADVLLGASATRDAADPFLGIPRSAGSARVPLDSVHAPRWLRLACGAPTTTGTTNYTHVFKSGASTLPSASVERAFPDKTRYHMHTGVRVNTLGVTIAPDGAADMTLGLLGLKEVRGGATGAGVPVNTAFTRFQRTRGTVRRDAANWASVTGGSFSFSNGMDLVATVRDQSSLPGVEGVDFGQVTAEGTIDVRYENDALDTLADALTPVAIDYTLTISANTSIKFEFPRAFLQKAPVAVRGPTGIAASHRFRAAYDATAACLMRVTVLNQVAAYA